MKNGHGNTGSFAGILRRNMRQEAWERLLLQRLKVKHEREE